MSSEKKDKYRVVVVGMGKRGMHHATAFQANPRFEVVGICDIDQAARSMPQPPSSAWPSKAPMRAALAKAARPDVFCFCTLPNLRTPMIQAGIESGARLIAFEKPVALTSAEGFEITQHAANERRQSSRQPSAPLRRALPQGQRNHRQRRPWAASTPSTARPPAG